MALPNRDGNPMDTKNSPDLAHCLHTMDLLMSLMLCLCLNALPKQRQNVEYLKEWRCRTAPPGYL